MMAPPDAETCEVRGELFRNLMLPVQAIRDFDKAIDLEPYFARCYAGRGRAYGMRGKKIEALRDFDTAIRLSPKQTFGYIARCNFYQDQKEPKLARADGEKALELAPHDIDVLAGFAQALCQAPQAEARDGKRALELANEAYRLDPNDWRTRSAMGAAYAEIGDFAKSEEFYRKALDLKALMSQQEAAITAYYVNRVRSGLPPMHN
jgi:tetratricopeptide (TPR) repeat protein